MWVCGGVCPPTGLCGGKVRRRGVRLCGGFMWGCGGFMWGVRGSPRECVCGGVRFPRECGGVLCGGVRLCGCAGVLCGGVRWSYAVMRGSMPTHGVMRVCGCGGCGGFMWGGAATHGGVCGGVRLCGCAGVLCGGVRVCGCGGFMWGSYVGGCGYAGVRCVGGGAWLPRVYVCGGKVRRRVRGVLCRGAVMRGSYVGVRCVGGGCGGFMWGGAVMRVCGGFMWGGAATHGGVCGGVRLCGGCGGVCPPTGLCGYAGVRWSYAGAGGCGYVGVRGFYVGGCGHPRGCVRGGAVMRGCRGVCAPMGVCGGKVCRCAGVRTGGVIGGWGAVGGR